MCLGVWRAAASRHALDVVDGPMPAQVGRHGDVAWDGDGRAPASSMVLSVSPIVPGSRRHASTVRAARGDFRPRLASAKAIWRPIPRLAPVTIATLPVSGGHRAHTSES
jgi:hypothetical protein